MVNGVAAQVDHVSPVATMQVRDLAGSPVFRWNKGYGGAGEPEAFPPVHLVDFFKTQPVDQVSYACGYNNGLVGRDAAKAFAVEVIEMGVGDQDEINVGKVMMGQPRMPKSPDHQNPIRPVRIHQDVAAGSLEEK